MILGAGKASKVHLVPMSPHPRQNPETVNMWGAGNMSVAPRDVTGGRSKKREESMERALQGRLCQCGHIMQGHRKMSSKNREKNPGNKH